MTAEPENIVASDGAVVYETDQAVSQYLDFHYGPPALGVRNFPAACGEAAVAAAGEAPRDRCLDGGAAVGRAAFEMARHWAHVDAVDYSTRFVDCGERLTHGEAIRYDAIVEGDLVVHREVSLEAAGLSSSGGRVRFMVGDACALDPTLSGYGLVFCGNLVDRLQDPGRFLRGIATRVVPGGVLVITTPYTWLESYTPRDRWLGGRMESSGPVTGFDGLARGLTEAFELVDRRDIPFVIRETARKHQHTIADFTAWRRRGAA
ncbi:MAG: putative 4-mercaptohistidine N1-methyltransferase [Planctomycetaceae bacterium]